MSDILTLKKSKPAKTPQSEIARLKKRISSLEKKIEKERGELDTALTYYKTEIEPHIKKECDLFQKRIQLAYHHLTTSSKFTAKEKKTLIQIIQTDLDDLAAHFPHENIQQSTRTIYEKLIGTSLEKESKDDLKCMLEEISEMLGQDLTKKDFSFLNSDLESEEKMRLFYQTILENLEPAKKPRKKTVELKKVEEKSLSSLYKQLARSFHPDLESDPKKKREKEELMKRLTSAYEEDDISTLLDLKAHAMLEEEGDVEFQTAVIHSLKKKVKELQDGYEMLFFNPRYAPLQQLNPDGFINLWLLKKFQKKLLHNQQILSECVEVLQTTDAVGFLKELIKREFLKID